MRVLIVGGGIGGVSAALALQRAGHETLLLEQAPELREVGAGIQVWANGPRVLRKLGLGALSETLRVGGFQEAGIREQDDGLLVQLDQCSIDAVAGEPSYFAHRAELLAGMVQALDATSIRLGMRATGFRQDPEGVQVLLEDGSEVQGDLLVGADGIHSRIRQQMGVGGEPRYAGFLAWRGIARFDDQGWERWQKGWGVYLGEGSQRGVFPLSDQRAYWFMTANHPTPELPLQEHHAHLLSDIDRWPPVLRAVLEATDPGEVLCGPIMDLAPFRGWSQGRVVLLGDAAHAMTPCLGQGGCMAMEDAYVLAELIGDGQRWRDALLRYEALRRPRTARAMRMARLFGRLLQVEGRFWRWLRRKLMPLTVPKDPARTMGWLLADCTQVHSLRR